MGAVAGRCEGLGRWDESCGRESHAWGGKTSRQERQGSQDRSTAGPVGRSITRYFLGGLGVPGDLGAKSSDASALDEDLHDGGEDADDAGEDGDCAGDAT